MITLSKKHWAVIVPVIVVVLGLYVLASFYVYQRMQTLRTDLASTNALAISLHEQLGYGGLIHNFKNYVLRADPELLQAARLNAAEAKVIARELENDAKRHGYDVTMNEVRSMIATYYTRLDRAQALHLQGRTPKQIDAAIPFDDSSALNEIGIVTDTLENKVNDEIADLQFLSAVQNMAAGIICMIALFTGINMTRLSRHRNELSVSNVKLNDSLERLEKANAALHQFAGIASHDLRTPIRHMRLCTQFIRDDIDDRDKVSGHAVKIEHAAQRMEDLVASLLDFARTSYQTPRVTRIDMTAIAQQAAEDFAPVTEEKNAVIDIRPLPTVEADSELMSRVLVNLIGNALKYSTDGKAPHIVIEAEERAGEVFFRISDNGIGIAAQHAEKIFKPLERLHDKNSKYAGVGIGLALTKSIVESHQGSIWLDPSRQDGASFVFTLPVTQAMTGQQNAA